MSDNFLIQVLYIIQNIRLCTSKWCTTQLYCTSLAKMRTFCNICPKIQFASKTIDVSRKHYSFFKLISKVMKQKKVLCFLHQMRALIFFFQMNKKTCTKVHTTMSNSGLKLSMRKCPPGPTNSSHCGLEGFRRPKQVQMKGYIVKMVQELKYICIDGGGGLYQFP